MRRYIFVIGGVMSGLGKGILSASTAFLLSSKGYNVSILKIDPYINVDAGTMNPYQHGEVFVTEDGGETDLDLGHYERFLNKNLHKWNNITTGKIYYNVIQKEREGKYLGQTVQVIPHITDEIKNSIREVGEKDNADILIIEIGGTVGDIESLPFLEAARQMYLEDRENVMFILIGLVPLSIDKEQKTKPLQHSVQELRRIGIQPDIIVGRSKDPLLEETKKKLSLFSNVPIEGIFSDQDLDIQYKLPIVLEKEGYLDYISKRLRLNNNKPDLSKLYDFIEKIENYKKVKRIAMIGKYTKVTDSYLSIKESLKIAGAYTGIKLEFVWIESTDIEDEKINIEDFNFDLAIVLPGFGARGVEGKIKALKYLRENNIQTLGICYGLQLMTVEIARNVLGLKDAHTTEVNPNTPYPVVDMMEEQKKILQLGGTMRLGNYPLYIKENTLAYGIYNLKETKERHRHRYEINNKYLDKFESVNYIVSGTSIGGLVEIMEYKDNKFFTGTQFHPEFNSKIFSPHPIFIELLKQ
ncbi:MAG: CTP synthase [Nanopusillaceae archaeon]